MGILGAFAIFMYLSAIVYLAKSGIVKSDLKILLGATGGLIAVLGFLVERYEKIVLRRIELQTSFYIQWRDLRKEIRSLKGQAGEAACEEKFTEYFQFLNHEYDMKHHLNPRILDFYKVYRENEFKDDTKYGNRTHKDWWYKISDKTLTKKFKAYVNDEIIKKLDKPNKSQQQTVTPKEDNIQAKVKYSDRRRNKRLKVSFEISLPDQDGKTINISASGVYFEVITNDRGAFSPGTMIQLQINTVTNTPGSRERKLKLSGRGTVIRNCIIEKNRIMIIALGVALEFTEKLNTVLDND